MTHQHRVVIVMNMIRDVRSFNYRLHPLISATTTSSPVLGYDITNKY